MNAASFDTLKAAETLQASGFSSEQAKALAEVQLNAITDFESSRELASKNDILQLRQEMAQMKADLVRWMVGLILGLGAFLVAVMAWLRP